MRRGGAMLLSLDIEAAGADAFGIALVPALAAGTPVVPIDVPCWVC